MTILISRNKESVALFFHFFLIVKSPHKTPIFAKTNCGGLMKELLIGMGIGFVVGAITCKTNKPIADTVEKGVEKGKEIIEDIKDEIDSQSKKGKKQNKNA